MSILRILPLFMIPENSISKIFFSEREKEDQKDHCDLIYNKIYSLLFFEDLNWGKITIRLQSSCREIIIIEAIMDGSNSLVSELAGDDYYVAQFKTTELAIFSYYIQSNKECLIIDPLFNHRSYSEFISKRHSNLKLVLLTHYHADFVSSHNDFGVPIIMGPQALRAANKFKVRELKDGEELALGKVRVGLIHTPGHTLESSCYLLKDSHHKQIAIFTGDTVFLGDVGRPDLAVGGNITSQDLAGMLYESVQKLRCLPEYLRLYPGHGSGSACGKSIGGGNFCTLGAQQSKNYGFLIKDKAQFIEQLIQNLPKPPKYFFHDAHLNQVGPVSYKQAYNKASNGLSLGQFHKLKSICKVVDTRRQPLSIIKGSYWLPESGPIANFISIFVTPTQDLILITQPGKAQEIIDRFLRIGYNNIKGYNNFDMSEIKEDIIKPTILKFITLKHVEHPTHLDVRNSPEINASGIIEGAIHIPLGELETRVGELKETKNIVINCLSGMRSKIAFSVLAKNGIQSKVLAQDFKEMGNNGIKVVKIAK